MEKNSQEKSLALCDKITKDIVDADVTAGDALAAVVLATSRLIDSIVGTTDATKEEVMDSYIKAFTFACNG